MVLTLRLRTVLMQVDKLVFFAGQAAVQRHVKEIDLCEANVAKWHVCACLTMHGQ